METFGRKSSAKRHINNQHVGLAEIMDFRGIPVRASSLLSYRSKEAQDKIRTTAGDLLFAEEYVREIAKNFARENFRLANESSNRMAMMNVIIQDAFNRFNNAKLGQGSISKDLDSFFKIYDEKE